MPFFLKDIFTLIESGVLKLTYVQHKRQQL